MKLKCAKKAQKEGNREDNQNKTGRHGPKSKDEEHCNIKS